MSASIAASLAVSCSAASKPLWLEKVNFPEGKDGDLDAFDPPSCLAVSAKRYVLFNWKDGAPIIRKAGHGLGHLLAPYDEPPAERRARIERIGVPLWQEDLWKEIIRAAETESPDQTEFVDMPGFDVPASSQYAATTPELLAWFKGYNARHKEGEKIFPFGFLLSLQAKSRLEPRMTPKPCRMNSGGAVSHTLRRLISSGQSTPRTTPLTANATSRSRRPG